MARSQQSSTQRSRGIRMTNFQEPIVDFLYFNDDVLKPTLEEEQAFLYALL